MNFLKAAEGNIALGGVLLSTEGNSGLEDT